MIEEFMVLANVAAAEELVSKRTPLLFRVHEEPSPEKLDALREVAQSAGLVLAKGQVLQTRHLNSLLSQASSTEFSEQINLSTLRSMTQAYYGRENLGHFGLALKNYAHFTSPIRRYSDLIVHRALVSANKWGKDGLLPDEIDRLEDTAKHISDTERRSMMAERDTTDRYLASYLSERVGAEFQARISGIAKFGVFARLDETGADGLIPIRTLGREYFRYDPDDQTLTGEETGLTLGLGVPVTVRLAEAVPVTGGLLLEMLTVDGKAMPKGSRRSSGKGPVRRKVNKSRRKKAKTARKVSRNRK
jgi:ribonuclease R